MNIIHMSRSSWRVSGVYVNNADIRLPDCHHIRCRWPQAELEDGTEQASRLCKGNSGDRGPQQEIVLVPWTLPSTTELGSTASAGQRHDQNPVSPPSGDDEFTL